MPQTIRLSGHLICAGQAECDLVRAHLAAHVHLTRQETGCLSFEVAQTEDPFVWSVEELFTDQAAFDFHQARSQASEWGRRTASIRRDYPIIAADRS